MLWIIYAMFGVMLFAIIFAVVVFAKQKRPHEDLGAQSYDVFAVSGGRLTILAGIPVTYELDEIEQITFSIMRAVRSTTVHNGILRVIKKNGKKSRPFMFNSSALVKKTVLVSSRQDIEETTRYLMEELRRHHIRCSRTV
ncbi:hypothetical protein LJC32_02590 [Oscillospiraceae bacterium OttesenSCG-928-F05]|nr:hypothetical protein [Oscillospiraceae bacterium OttesenSCG-928-F05]